MNPEDRREYMRAEVPLKANAFLNDIVVQCVVKNISGEGAYLEAMGENAETLSGDFIGQSIEIAFNENESIRAKIVRYEETGTAKRIGVQFEQS